MNLKPIIKQLKEVLKEKGHQVEFPDNKDTAVGILESEIRGEYSVSVGVGEVSMISRKYFNIQGKVFDDTFNKFTDSSLKIEPDVIKSKKGEDYTCVVVKEDLMREMAMADWDGKFNTINDLIDVLKEL